MCRWIRPVVPDVHRPGSTHRHSPIARILVIEDNEDLAFGLKNNLEIEGYAVELASEGAVGLARARGLDRHGL